MVIVVIAFVGVLMAAAALVVDVGRWLIALHEAQNAADAAALAGMQELLDGKLTYEQITEGQVVGAPQRLPKDVYYWTDPGDMRMRCRLMGINAQPDDLPLAAIAPSDLFGPGLTPTEEDLFNSALGRHPVVGSPGTFLTTRPSERMKGWYGVKYAVMAAIATSRLSYLTAAARNTLVNGVSNTTGSFAFTDTTSYETLDVQNDFRRQRGTTADRNLTIQVDRGYECRRRFLTNDCSAGAPCERRFRSLELPVMGFDATTGEAIEPPNPIGDGRPRARQKGIFANAVRVKITVRNISMFFFRFFGLTQMDQVEATAVASAIATEVGVPACYAAQAKAQIRAGDPLDCVDLNSECDPSCDTWDDFTNPASATLLQGCSTSTFYPMDIP